jgi:hypothetical protein
MRQQLVIVLLLFTEAQPQDLRAPNSAQIVTIRHALGPFAAQPCGWDFMLFADNPFVP